MVDSNYFLNCPVDKTNFTDTDKANVTFTSRSSVVNLLEVGTLTRVAVALIVDVLINLYVKVNIFDFISERDVTSYKKKLYQLNNTKVFSRIFLLTFLVLSLPIVTLCLLLAFSYKVLCSVIIKRKDKLFVGFLNSFDVFWSLEDDTSKSIINVLGIVESESPDTITSDIKQKLQNIISNEITRKIFYRRHEEFGFYYWRRYKNIDINQYVEVVELPKKETEDCIDELEDLMTELQNQPLPYGDEGLFKILITRQRVGNLDKQKGEYGIIFRIHHSVGDGVALVDFLCHTLADQGDQPAHMFSLPEMHRKTESVHNILDMMHKLFEIPVCFVDGILRKPDDSALHGSKLSGKKIFKWTESDENLLFLVKEIKDNVDKLNFSDILLTALSSGLRSFYSETMAAVPEDVAIVLPIRFPKRSTTNGQLLTNDFSVTILDVPVNDEDSSRINTIQNRCNKLRQSADPLTNYYFLKLVSGILPKSMLESLLNSRQATMVFSNMPGPEELSICGGNVLKELVFFVPHKGTTGLGVTALCYGGVLRLAAMADTALVPTANDLAVILEGMVREIKRLHSLHVTK